LKYGAAAETAAVRAVVWVAIGVRDLVITPRKPSKLQRDNISAFVQQVQAAVLLHVVDNADIQVG
jgi:hypothetical protein